MKSILFYSFLFSSFFSMSFADDAQKPKVSGHARVRTEVDDYTNYLNERFMTLIRVRPRVTWNINQNSRLILEPQFARILGESGVSAASTVGSSEQLSGSTADPVFGVHQAYMMYQLSEVFNVTVGRQVLSFGDELVVGPLEWNNVARTFDALRLQVIQSPYYQFDYFWSKLVDTNTQGSGSGDHDFFGAYHAWKSESTVQEKDLYLFYSKDSRGNGADPLGLATAGLRLKTSIGRFHGRFEGTQQLGRVNGTRADSHGTQIDLELSYGVSEKHRLGLEVFHADAEYNQLYPTLHKWLGIADVFGRRNIQGAHVFLNGQMTDRSRLMTDIHFFYKSESSLNAYRLNGTPLTGSAGNGNYLGSELDLVYHYSIDPENSIQGGGGLFFSGHSMRRVRQGNPIFSYISWEMKY